MPEYTTTIAAVSTPPGKGGVALIRLSGEDAVTIAERVFAPMAGRGLSERPPRTAVYGRFLSGGVAVDDGMALYFPAPHSYTGEDTVEFTCHGGTLVTHVILEALFSAGAEPASAGEFTRRAFLNGRLSLSKAEAIGTLLEAKSRAQILLSAGRDRLSDRLDALYGEALALLSNSEAAIDFPEEDLAEMTAEEQLRATEALAAKVAALTDTYRTGHAVSEGVPTVICGRPNVGKSTLYNLLLGEDAAIVSETAGTTRDVLERNVSLGRVLLRLADTAGIRVTEDPLERIGVDRARRALTGASLVFAVFDSSEPLQPEDHALIAALRELPAVTIAILNKSDLPPALHEKDLAEFFPHIVTLSAQSGTFDLLSALVNRLFTDETLTLGDDAIVFSARQHAALSRAADHLRAACDLLRGHYPADMTGEEMREALAALGQTNGREVNEDVVAEIFSHFCVGK